MKLSSGIGLAGAIAAQIAAFYVVLLHWPTLPSFVALLLLLFVFTPLMFVFCLDVVRSFKAQAASPVSVIGRVIFSLPIIALAMLALLIGVAFTVAFGFMLFSERALQIILSLPEVLAILFLFFLFGFGLFRVVFSRKHDNTLP